MLIDTSNYINFKRQPHISPEILNEWLEKEQAVSNQVRRFNQKVSNSTLTISELEVISEIITKEVNRLTELTQAAEQREEELNQHQYCYNTSSKELQNVFTIDGCAKLIQLGGMITNFFAEDPTVDTIAFAISIAGFAVDYFAQKYGLSIQVRQFETVELARFNKENAEGAKVFKDFLIRLIEVKKMEVELIEKNKELSSPLKQRSISEISIHLDEEDQIDKEDQIDEEDQIAVEQAIGKCLQQYEKLPKNFQNKKVYCRVLSDLIYGLPEEHLLAKGFKELEPDLGKTASLPIQTDYLDRDDIRSGEQGTKSYSSFFFQWSNSTEEKPRKIFERTGSYGNVSGIERERKISDTDYREKVGKFKNILIDRLGLTLDIPHLETKSGWQISDIEEIIPASLTYEEDEINFREIRAPFSIETPDDHHPLNPEEMV